MSLVLVYVMCQSFSIRFKRHIAMAKTFCQAIPESDCLYRRCTKHNEIRSVILLYHLFIIKKNIQEQTKPKKYIEYI